MNLLEGFKIDLIWSIIIAISIHILLRNIKSIGIIGTGRYISIVDSIRGTVTISLLLCLISFPVVNIIFTIIHNGLYNCIKTEIFNGILPLRIVSVSLGIMFLIYILYYADTPIDFFISKDTFYMINIMLLWFLHIYNLYNIYASALTWVILYIVDDIRIIRDYFIVTKHHILKKHLIHMTIFEILTIVGGITSIVMVDITLKFKIIILAIYIILVYINIHFIYKNVKFKNIKDSDNIEIIFKEKLINIYYKEY